jgi:hypothetical protein
MSMTTISTKFQIVIPKDVREKLHLSPSAAPAGPGKRRRNYPWFRKCHSSY